MNPKEILLNTIIGDTLGRPFVSISSGHIKSSIKNIESYVDPEILLKDKLEKWVKPGLYSSISQFIIIIGMSFSRKKFNTNKFIDIIKKSPEIENRDSGIFRNTGQVEDNLISNIKNNIFNDNRPETVTSKIIPFIIPVSLINKNEEICIFNSIEIITLFTTELSTISAGIILSMIIHSLINKKKSSLNNIIALAIESCENIIHIINTKPENIFNIKINPGSLLTFINNYKNIFLGIKDSSTPRDAEKKICSFAKKSFKISAKRCNLNVPLLLIPYTFFLIQFNSHDHSSILIKLLYEGGQTSTMLSIAGALLSCQHGDNSTPEFMKNKLINKKKISSILENILLKDFSDNLIAEFINSERLLTIKEEQELKSKLKHYHKKKKKKKPTIDKNKELTRHVVESWTKIDKAKWKKQRKKIKNN